MDKRHHILIFDEQGFFYGSTQKLERQIAKILSKDFKVIFAYGKGKDGREAEELQSLGITLVPFDFRYRQAREPFKLVGMKPSIGDIIKAYNIRCVYTSVFAHYQFPINVIPASIPLVLISPFGHYASNGGVYKTYVSGKDNCARILNRGVKNVECFFNPLTDYPPNIINKPPVGDTVVFGRMGRGEDSIFDPIALRAFKKLEDKYGKSVRYIVVNPPPGWRKIAAELGIKNMEFREPITDFETLSKFYGEIDVLAHARKDGETVGIAIGEAMLAGNPIITHKSYYHNDHLELLDKSYARWCEADDVEAYFENMAWMVENKSQIRAMGQKARAKALEVFGLEKIAAELIITFHSACERYYYDSFFGKIKGYMSLYWENLKAMPFLLGKLITYQFPSLYKKIRRFYHA